MRKYWIFTLILSSGLIQGCAAPLASSAGTTVVTAAAANPMTATSVASTVATGKSPLEHVASAATKKECNFTNIIGPKPICEDVVLPKIIDNSSPLPGPADKPKETIKQ